MFAVTVQITTPSGHLCGLGVLINKKHLLGCYITPFYGFFIYTFFGVFKYTFFGVSFNTIIGVNQKYTLKGVNQKYTFNGVNKIKTLRCKSEKHLKWCPEVVVIWTVT